MNTLTLIPSWLNQPAIHLVLVTALMLATTGRVFAADSAEDTNGKTPTSVVTHTIETVLSRIDAEAAQLNGDPEKLAALVSEVVVPHLDTTRISRMVLGKSWRKADEQQFKRFSGEFQTLLIRTYATSLNQYTGEEIQFPSREKLYKNGTAAVELDIQRPHEPSIGLEFRMHNKLGPWLVYDIKIEGISLVANYRSEFSNIVRSKGLDALITVLESKNRGTRIASSSR
jgi:phospholipid transport system substrate-binding protein